MPWADKVPSIMHTWYLGNATGDAIADVLTGNVNPSGKLPLTFPKRLEDVPAHGHFNSENGVVCSATILLLPGDAHDAQVRYSEDIFVGYKGYALRKIEPMWAFGSVRKQK
jgi:beta-glucosidase